MGLIDLIKSGLNNNPTPMQKDILKGMLRGELITALYNMDVMINKING
jgi:hypothetical protein